MSEALKYKHLFQQFCRTQNGEPGCGADIGSQGFCTIPWAIQLDLPPKEFSAYCGGAEQHGPIALRGDAKSLPFDTGSLDFLIASHLLEDYLDWLPVLIEWVRVLKPGGKLIILVPDKKLWNEAIARGQPPNCAHKHESHVGELSTYAAKLGLTVIEDRLTAVCEGDYSIIFCAAKL